MLLISLILILLFVLVVKFGFWVLCCGKVFILSIIFVMCIGWVFVGWIFCGCCVIFRVGIGVLGNKEKRGEGKE